MVEDLDRRKMALDRVKEKRAFWQHLVTYAVVNGFLVFIWAVTGAGYFWPAWSLGGWGIAIVMHLWTAYGQRPITEADIEAEMQRIDHYDEHHRAA